MSKSDVRNEANFDQQRLQSVSWRRAAGTAAPPPTPGYYERAAGQVEVLCFVGEQGCEREMFLDRGAMSERHKGV
jgi:hypothetical protein